MCQRQRLPSSGTCISGQALRPWVFNDDADDLGTCSRVRAQTQVAGDHTLIVAGYNGGAVGAYTVNIDW